MSDIISQCSEDTSAIQPPIEVHFEEPGFAAVVKLCGEHDIATNPDLGAALAPLHGSVLVDLTACAFIDSTTIGLIIARSQEITREGYALELAYTTGTAVGRVLEVIRIDTLLTVHPRGPVAARPTNVGDGNAELIVA